MTDYDRHFKVCVVGDSGVGKSSILVRFTDDEFDEDLQVTIGVDFKSKKMNVDGQSIQLSIWDTAGQEKFRSLTGSYYRGTHAVILTYDITNSASFESITMWLDEAKNHCSSVEPVLLLVGNKIDRESERSVAKESAADFARRHGMLFIECSAKTKHGVEQVFEELVHKILERPELLKGTASNRIGGGVALGQSSQADAEAGYCAC